MVLPSSGDEDHKKNISRAMSQQDFLHRPDRPTHHTLTSPLHPPLISRRQRIVSSMNDVAEGAAYAVLYTVLCGFTLLAIIAAGYFGQSNVLVKLGCIMRPTTAATEDDVMKTIKTPTSSWPLGIALILCEFVFCLLTALVVSLGRYYIAVHLALHWMTPTLISIVMDMFHFCLYIFPNDSRRLIYYQSLFTHSRINQSETSALASSHLAWVHG